MNRETKQSIFFATVHTVFFLDLAIYFIYR